MELYQWQEKVIEESPIYPKRALFAAPRLGKTLATTLMLQKNLTPGDVSLVLAPLSVCATWRGELESRDTRVIPLYAQTVAEGSEILWDLSRGLRNPSRHPYERHAIILNYDKLPDLVPPLKRLAPRALVCDESHLLKNPRSARSKAVRKIAGKVEFTRVLTGTPSPNHYGDLWAQMTLVNPVAWGTGFTAFAQKYLIRDAIYPSKIIGHNHVPELQAMLRADADIVRREDVFGPDTYQCIERDIDMPDDARRVYDSLVREWLVYHELGGEVVGDHTLKRLVRLQQISSGYLRNEEGQDFNLHTAKIDAVLADLNEIIESNEKAVIFHRFRWEGERYVEELRRAYPRLPVYSMCGDTPPAVRADGEAQLRGLSGPVVMVAQTRAAALGISLAEATHALFVSQSFSFVEEEQARDRIYKPGAVRVVTYYRCNDTVDNFVAGVINSKRSIHEAVTHADIREMAYGALRRR